MMSPKIEISISKHARKGLAKIGKFDAKLRKVLDKYIDALRANPEAGKELDFDLRGMRSLKPDGDGYHNYRILYVLTGSRLIIRAVGHRKNVYHDMARKTIGLGGSN